MGTPQENLAAGKAELERLKTQAGTSMAEYKFLKEQGKWNESAAAAAVAMKPRVQAELTAYEKKEIEVEEVLQPAADAAEEAASNAAKSQTLNAAETLKNIKDVPGVAGAKILTVQSDGLFADGALPGAAASGIASAQQTASEVARDVGGSGVANTVTPEVGGNRLIKAGHTTEDFKMKLRSKQTGFTIVFDVTPSIDESRSANYEHITPVHHPGTIQVYKNTEARQFNITVKLIARTAAEASMNVKYINAIRSWVMPYYGQGTANSSESNRLGAPPDILVFDVYGDKNISALPVVLTSYHWVYPDIVDFIPTEDGIPFPTIMDISLSLIESYSPEEYTNFDITAYRTGNMANAYSFASVPGQVVLPDADMASDAEAEMRAIAEGYPDGYF